MAGVNSVSSDYSWLFKAATSPKQKQNSGSGLLENYFASQQNATSELAGLQEVNANLKSLMASYEEAKSAFNSELSENMDFLSKSAEKVKGYDFHVKKEGAITKTTETDKDGNVTETTTYSKELQAALDTVKEFVGDYNTSLAFFKDNASISKRVENMANTFGDAIYRASAYEAIGLNVNSDGSFTINEDKLVNAIINDPGKVSRTLGKDGLAGKAEEHISFANSQKENLFPTAQAMFGDQLDAASIYTSKAYRIMTAYSNMGNLFNMMS
ncbi:MAG: hypothetical protein J5497_03410 [Selenomonadaceae bacterium]|nr:hypothetical protein [Selenomonadaceae bacterium]